MAQQQPMSGGKVEAMSDLTYDLVAELACAAEAVDSLDTYIDDAKKENLSDVAQLLTQIRDNEIRHCDMLRKVISDKVVSGTF